MGRGQVLACSTWPGKPERAARAHGIGSDRTLFEPVTLQLRRSKPRRSSARRWRVLRTRNVASSRLDGGCSRRTQWRRPQQASSRLGDRPSRSRGGHALLLAGQCDGAVRGRAWREDFQGSGRYGDGGRPKDRQDRRGGRCRSGVRRQPDAVPTPGSGQPADLGRRDALGRGPCAPRVRVPHGAVCDERPLRPRHWPRICCRQAERRNCAR